MRGESSADMVTASNTVSVTAPVSRRKSICYLMENFWKRSQQSGGAVERGSWGG